MEGSIVVHATHSVHICEAERLPLVDYQPEQTPPGAAGRISRLGILRRRSSALWPKAAEVTSCYPPCYRTCRSTKMLCNLIDRLQ